jgi:hypothetical protein
MAMAFYYIAQKPMLNKYPPVLVQSSHILTELKISMTNMCDISGHNHCLVIFFRCIHNGAGVTLLCGTN